MSEALAQPFRIGPLELPHRVVMAPMTRNRAGSGNVPQALNSEYYRQRASAALVITEATQVSEQGVGYPLTPGIHSPGQVAGWQAVTDAVHRAGGRIALQLWHVGRISHSSLQPGGALPVAPSAIAAAGEAMTFEGMKPFETPRALETDEIPGIVEQFRLGARNAMEAGFDAVEIHGGNGYLLDQFVRDGTNARSDAYGGTLANRLRLPLEVAEAVSEIWGADRVGFRISPYQRFNDMTDSAPEATFAALAGALDGIGIAWLHVVESDAPGRDTEACDARDFVAARPPLFRTLREEFGRALIVNSAYDGPRGEAVLGAGQADLVSYATLFLANPDLPKRLLGGGPLNAPARKTYYGGGAAGYTDYPFWDG
ncbi:MAG: alkene reductase [Defluviicoccus sp.]|nr:alkene reductase [Defluviicoccus sp.]MDE0383888.1 alkene reductase [Defluviicoccus sp.]